jgi:GntR family transcriptional regulator
LDRIDTSKTLKLYLLLKERITSGSLADGERLPGEPRLASAHGLSRVTVRRALDGLERDGLIRRRPGSGTFVRREVRPMAMSADLSDMLASLAAMGRETDVRLLSFDYGPPPRDVAAALCLPPAAEVQRAVRLRLIDGTPFSFLTTHVPARIGRLYSADDIAATPLLSLLERAGVMVERAEQTLSATLAGPEVAEALGIGVGSALVSMTRTVFGADGAGVEHLSALYRPDMYRFHMELTRTGSGVERRWRPADSAGSHQPGRKPAPQRRTGP